MYGLDPIASHRGRDVLLSVIRRLCEAADALAYPISRNNHARA